MIRNETEYQEAVKRVGEEKARLARYVRQWKAKGYGRDEIAALKEPLQSFHMQLVEEVRSYERLKRGQFEQITNLRGLGQLLIALRIAGGLSQRDLAQKLGVHESQVSRDERNEYHGITLDRAARILEALGAELHSTVERTTGRGAA